LENDFYMLVIREQKNWFLFGIHLLKV
jgi:hypothetical protein